MEIKLSVQRCVYCDIMSNVCVKKLQSSVDSILDRHYADKSPASDRAVDGKEATVGKTIKVSSVPKTGDKKNPKASALAISDGRFVYVGDEEGVKDYIDKNTPDVSDGIITRDEQGNPTGYFREGAMDLLKELTVFSVEQYKEGFLHYQEEYLANGETLVLEPIINWDTTDNAAIACHELDMEGKLHMHIYAAYQVFQAEGHDTMAEIEHAAQLREKTKGSMFEITNIKIQIDGTMPGTPSTAYMKEPYTDPWSIEHQHRGQLRFDMETLIKIYIKSHELGFTVHAHAIGDGALSMALDAIEKALEQTGEHDYRDAITHLQVVDRADIPRMAKLNVIASTDPHWFDFEPEYFEMMVAVLGEERAEAQLPGRPDTLHNARERVTIEQMIEATTINEAYQMLCEDRLGSITVGKEADLVVLGDDITKCDSEHIQDSPVLGTMVGGKWVYTCN